MKHLFRILLTSALLLASAQSYAQGKEDPLVADTMKNIWIVTGVAAAGAVLGLSTLSFVDEPSENLKNIVTGGAIGVIVGVGIVAYQQATKSKEMYQYGFVPSPLETQEQFSTVMRSQWHRDSFSSNQQTKPASFLFNKTF